MEIILWIVSLESAYGLKAIVACISISILLGGALANRIMKDKDTNVVVEPISAPSSMALMFSTSLASIAKAAIYQSRSKPIE